MDDEAVIIITPSPSRGGLKWGWAFMYSFDMFYPIPLLTSPFEGE